MTPDGKRYLGLRDHLIPKYMELAKRKINFALLLGQHISNPALVSSIGAKSLRTRGLIPEVLQNGVVQGYSATTGFGKEDLRDLALRIKERQLCSSTYMLYAGIHLKNAINDTFGTETNGQYQVLFNGCEDKCYSNAFTFLSDSGIDIHIKELDIANDTQTLGANGYSYPKEGLLVPVGTVAQSRKMGDGSFEKVASPYLGLKYFKNKFMDENFLDHRTFSHCDKISVSLETMVGLDVTASNAFGLIKVQA